MNAAVPSAAFFILDKIVMKILRTPESQFDNLEGYNFSPNYLSTQDGLRMHYVDEGDKSAPVVLMLHGEPSWSYLYRKMIPIFVDAGFRAVAPDLIGFGKSDKPSEKSDYTYQRHLDWLSVVFEELDLRNVTLFVQDWGGLLGLRLLEKYDHIIDNVVAANTFLSTGFVEPNEPFMAWRKFSQEAPKFDVARVIKNATVSKLSDEVLRGYNAPFPTDEYKAGARIFPSLVPVHEDEPEARNNKETWNYLAKYQKPFLTLFSDSDPIMSGLEKIFQKYIPGAKGQAHTIIQGGGHFLQEDKGEEIAHKMIEFKNKHS